MANDPSFSGFSRETVRFFNGLRRNNRKDWFENHRRIYDAHVMDPARAFVAAMGARLRTIVPGIIADARVNKSIFRLNRDTRFSLDPSPYKTNLGIYFWEGGRSRMEFPGFYFHLEPPVIILGGGFYLFPAGLIDRYRRAVVDPVLGGKLSNILAGFATSKDLGLGGKHYKRVPAGFDAAHPNAELLKHNGLHVGMETKIPEELFSPRLIDYCFVRFERMAPLHRWLVRALL